MSDPFLKYLNLDEQKTIEKNKDPFLKFLNADERPSDFKISTEAPAVDYTKPYQMPEDNDPFSKYLDPGEFGTGTQEDIALSKKISNAFKLGFADTVRGVRQMSISRF